MRVLLVFLSFLAACGDGGDRPRVRLVTTTSTENSGLIAYLLKEFSEREGIEVDVLAVGTGQALKLGQRGDADIVLVHAREREDAFMAAGFAVERRDVMWNDFVLLGPPSDPAGVKGEKSISAAFGRIAAAGAEFLSRGDDSGTHLRERSIWERAGVVPAGKDFYLEAGQGMGRCLIMANELGAYLLADRGTFLAFRAKLELVVLVEGGAAMRNPYGALLVKPGVAAARKLFDYLTSPEGQRRIGAFRVDGEQLFHPVSGPVAKPG